ncbi:hypothetical protein [Alcanivorax sp. 1008]|uniref:hypothetical protein n=1 Tax=Alcanivorax sp. 1008 TaxID=2816853 RepID=UPI001D514830|nr:hypothetical protein [Alcanivorax sp. 1008]MCC1496010.1 hypothetical protein [Alcanivorax sp. 1008]
MPAKPVIGISGSGFIGRGLADHLARGSQYQLGPVLSRRPAAQISHPYAEKLCGDMDTLLRHSDLIVECSGDVLHATEVVEQAMAAGKPVVTMNTEFHITVGSAFVGQGILSEAEGDQPGSLAALYGRTLSMGFEPLVLGNIKGFLNHHPTPKDMRYWAERQGISLAQVTAFTDGSKIQCEQALVANGCDARIARPGMLGPVSANLQDAALTLAAEAESLGGPISDYVLNAGGPAGIFIVGRHPDADALRYLKLGEGPYYFLLQPFQLCHLEIPSTIAMALRGEILLNNSKQPKTGVIALAKKDMQPGEKIDRGLGGFQCRGEAVPFSSHHQHPPIGLLQQATVEKPINAGSPIRWEQISLPESRALTLFRQLLDANPA